MTNTKASQPIFLLFCLRHTTHGSGSTFAVLNKCIYCAIVSVALTMAQVLRRFIACSSSSSSFSIVLKHCDVTMFNPVTFWTEDTLCVARCRYTGRSTTTRVPVCCGTSLKGRDQKETSRHSLRSKRSYWFELASFSSTLRAACYFWATMRHCAPVFLCA